MFPKWENDVEDKAVENIIKLMYVRKPWKWTMDYWEVTGSWVNTKPTVVKEESRRPRKKARIEARQETPAEASQETPGEDSQEATEASQEASEASETVPTTVGGLTKEEIQRMLKDLSDVMNDGFEKCVKEIKHLSERVEALENKVGITTKLKGTSSPKTPSPTKPGVSSVNERKSLPEDNAGGKSLPEDNGPDLEEDLGEDSLLVLDKHVPTAEDLEEAEARRQAKKEAYKVKLRAKSERDRKLAPTQQTPFKGNSTVKQIIPNKIVGKGYDPFAEVDKMKSDELTTWLQTDPAYKRPLDKKPLKCPSRFYEVIRTPLKWFTDHQMDAFLNLLRQRYQDHPDWFRSSRMCFLDHVFSRQWRADYHEFKNDIGDVNGLARKLPGGAWNYHSGEVPSFCQSMKVWGEDVDDIYAPVNYNDTHWIAIWISIPNRHIVVWDSIIRHISPAELDKVMEPFIYMVPYLLCECAVTDEQKTRYTLEPYTYERLSTGVPQCRSGDCGPFALKYIECHALGMDFPKELCSRNGKLIREKMAVDIYEELNMIHEWESKDDEKVVGTYDEIRG